MCQFSVKINNFFCPDLSEKGLGFETEKNNVGIKITLVKTPCVPQFSAKLDNFDFFDPNLPKKEFWVSEFQKSKSGFGFCTSKIPCVPIFS